MGKYMLVILVAVLLQFLNCTGQTTDEKIRVAAREIMEAAPTCALITQDAEGRSRVRAMDGFVPEDDFTVWFGTNPKSRKVDQIKNDPRVTLYYLGQDDSGYVMLHGNAEIVDDKTEKEKRWKPEWEEFYPDKTKSFILIKVIPEWIEVVSYPHGLVGDTLTWEPPVVHFDCEKK